MQSNHVDPPRIPEDSKAQVPCGKQGDGLAQIAIYAADLEPLATVIRLSRMTRPDVIHAMIERELAQQAELNGRQIAGKREVKPEVKGVEVEHYRSEANG